MKVRMNGLQFAFPGKEISELRESNDLLSDQEKLMSRIHEDGYLLIRNLIDRKKVMRARQIILEDLDKEGRIKPSTDLMEGIVNPNRDEWRAAEEGSLHNAEFNEEVQAVIDAEELHTFFDFLIGESSISLDLKIIRRVPTGSSTGIHYDVVYMGRGTKQVYSCWIPLGDITVEQGPLAVCAGSNSEVGFERLIQTYGQHDVDSELMHGTKGSFPGWFSFDLSEITDKFGGEWQTTNYRAGDVIIITLFTLHCGLDNTTDRFRLSSDVRFQAKSEPVDKRWMGDGAPGNVEAHQLFQGKIKTTETIDDARKKWDV